MRALFALLLAAVGVLLFTSLSRAAGCDLTWTGLGGTTSSPVSGLWATGSNWSGGGGNPPSATQNACLPASGSSYTVTLNGAGTANSVTVNAGATLAVAISGGNGATLTLSSNGSSTNGGTIDLTDADSSGSSSTPARIELDSGASLTNDGTIVSNGTGGSRFIDGQSAARKLTNATSGTIIVDEDLQIDSSQGGLFTTSPIFRTTKWLGVLAVARARVV